MNSKIRYQGTIYRRHSDAHCMHTPIRYAKRTAAVPSGRESVHRLDGVKEMEIETERDQSNSVIIDTRDWVVPW